MYDKLKEEECLTENVHLMQKEYENNKEILMVSNRNKTTLLPSEVPSDVHDSSTLTASREMHIPCSNHQPLQFQLIEDYLSASVSSINKNSQMQESITLENSTIHKTFFTFDIKKAYYNFDIFRIKPSTIAYQVEIDLIKHILVFKYPNSPSQVFLCADANAELSLKVGLQITISTGISSVIKRLDFSSSIERSDFLAALEKGKEVKKREMEDRKEEIQEHKRLHHILHNKEDNQINDNKNSVFKKFYSLVDKENIENRKEEIQEEQKKLNQILNSHEDNDIKEYNNNLYQKFFSLLDQEKVNSVLLQVIYELNPTFPEVKSSTEGILYITNYRLLFIPLISVNSSDCFELPLASIEIININGFRVVLTCRNMRIIRLLLRKAYVQEKTLLKESSISNPQQYCLNVLRMKINPYCPISRLFAFEYTPIKKPSASKDGWLVYSPLVEYHRLGLINRLSLKEEIPSKWRILKNSRYRFSPTYPFILVVPTCMTETELIESSHFRSRSRLPIVVWRHPEKNSVLVRSSQPNYGMTRKRCESDRKLLWAYRVSANRDHTGKIPKLHIVDARNHIASKGNRLKGKGVENPQHYDGAQVEFMRIANIHKMRDSIEVLTDFLHPNFPFDVENYFIERVEETRWLHHIRKVISGSIRVAELLDENGATVLCHCSDGWDRTPQLVATAQLLLDPFYRTIRGFAILVEKEWCSFGHKFSDRIGVGKEPSDQPNERSPVMLQWLDCVWQIQDQYPNAFEYDQKLLLHVADALTNGLYGTFLFNSERERIYDKIWKRTQSVWTTVLENLEKYKNNKYDNHHKQIYQYISIKQVKLWKGCYCRWTSTS